MHRLVENLFLCFFESAKDFKRYHGLTMKKDTVVYPPGTILQRMHLKHRLHDLIRNHGVRTFIEFGSGDGTLSSLLLSSGLSGRGYDLNPEVCELNRQRNRAFIESGKYAVLNCNFFESQPEKVDVVISSHVVEHLSVEQEEDYYTMVSRIAHFVICLVPAGMRYWGIEDETSGHYHRYSFRDFVEIAGRYNFVIRDMRGLTFPLSNLLLKMSNHLVAKQESWKQELSKQEQTKLSPSGGAKKIMFKTHFPAWLRFFLNRLTMYPFYLLQKIFRRSKRSMVIYCEYGTALQPALRGLRNETQN